ncbi:MAG: hypothetical protein IPL61_32185 [Myxococcales bacterium]|nr:hypothetical protein [Myxococcales bacterium]
MVRAVALLSIAALAGCSLYFNDGGDAVPDAGEACGAVDTGPPLELRNPDNLECVSFGGGQCPPGCPCPLSDSADQAPAPGWGVCGGPCDVLGELDCMVDDQCRAAYDYDCYTGTQDCAALTAFLGCFSLSQTFSAGACEGLDSWSCSARNDCIALHKQVCDASGACWPQFFECRSEGR